MTIRQHPNGVLPEGNMFLCTGNPMAVRTNGLGRLFSKLSDETISELVAYLDGISLAKLAMTSKVLYIFAHVEPLWRDLTLIYTKGKDIKFINSWKETYATMIAKHTVPTIIPLQIKGFYSQYLFQQWLCKNFDVHKDFPHFFKHEDVPRVSAKDLTIRQFLDQYEKPNTPVIITDIADDWPALKKWNAEYISQISGDLKYRSSSATAVMPTSFTFADYCQYASKAQEESPLYLFSTDFANIDSLTNEYTVPPYFDPVAYAAEGLNKECIETDLFRVMGKTRPDYRWLICGPANSGSLFHIDPNDTHAWNICLQGHKKWIFYPPGVPPPGVVCSNDGGEAIVPVSIGEWLLSFWSFHLEERHNNNPAFRPLECVVGPGELVFVPHGWWHMVINLDFCIAITQNYVSTTNLSNCLHFLRDKSDYISGMNSVPIKNFYEDFVDNLPTIVSKELIDKHLTESVKRDYRHPSGNFMKSTCRIHQQGNNHKKKKRKGLEDHDIQDIQDNHVPIVEPTPQPNFMFSFDL